MPRMIELNNGEYFSLFCFEDALEIVEELGGRELRDFIEEYMQDNIDDAAYEKLEAEKAGREHETNERRYREVLLALRDGLDNLTNKLNDGHADGHADSHANREDMKNLVAAMCESVEEVL